MQQNSQDSVLGTEGGMNKCDNDDKWCINNDLNKCMDLLYLHTYISYTFIHISLIPDRGPNSKPQKLKPKRKKAFCLAREGWKEAEVS